MTGQALREAAGIVGLAVAWALGWNAIDPRGIRLDRPIPRRADSDGRFLTHAQATERFHRGQSVFVDVRNLAAWRVVHIPSAIHLPADTFGDAWARHGARLDPGDELILYCDGPHCDLAARLVPRFEGLGFRRVKVYEGGVEEWVAGRQPVASGDAP